MIVTPVNVVYAVGSNDPRFVLSKLYVPADGAVNCTSRLPPAVIVTVAGVFRVRMITLPPPPITVSGNVLGFTDTAVVAPVMLPWAIDAGNVRLYEAVVVGVPVIGTVTTVALVRTAVPAVNPAGRPLLITKFAAVIVGAYVPFVRVYVTLAPLTAWPTLKLLSPFAAPVIVNAGVTVSGNCLGFTDTAAVAPVILLWAIVAGNVRLYEVDVVGVPVMGTVTTVALVRTAVPAVNPAGRPLLIAKFDAVIVDAYVPFARVYVTLAPLAPLTA